MASENETVAEIVGEMRGIKNRVHPNGGRAYENFRIRCEVADEYADRIEAAKDMRDRDYHACDPKLCEHLARNEDDWQTAFAEQKRLNDLLIKERNEAVTKCNRLEAALREICDITAHHYDEVTTFGYIWKIAHNAVVARR